MNTGKYPLFTFWCTGLAEYQAMAVFCPTYQSFPHRRCKTLGRLISPALYCSNSHIICNIHVIKNFTQNVVIFILFSNPHVPTNNNSQSHTYQSGISFSEGTFSIRNWRREGNITDMSSSEKFRSLTVPTKLVVPNYLPSPSCVRKIS